MIVYPIILALLNRFVRGQDYVERRPDGEKKSWSEMNNKERAISIITSKSAWGGYAGTTYYGLTVATGSPDPVKSLIIVAGLTIWAIHNMGLILITRRAEELNDYRTWFFTPFYNVSVLGNALIYTVARHGLLLAPLCWSLAFYDMSLWWVLKWLLGTLGITASYFVAGIKESVHSVGGAELATGAILGSLLCL